MRSFRQTRSKRRPERCNVLLRSLLLFSISGCALGCAGVTVVSPRPEVCTEWTRERADEYGALIAIGTYPEVAQMLVEWNEACAYNAALLGIPWEPPSEPCMDGWFQCKWQTWSDTRPEVD